MTNPPKQEDKAPVTNPPRDGNEPGPAGADSSARWSRRRFGKAALVATPVLATLYGRPLHAAANCTPSGWVSGNTSMHHDLQDCGGRTPGYWQSDNSKWQNDGWKATYMDLLDSPTGFPGLSFYVGDRPATCQDAVEGPGQTPFNGTTTLVRQIMRFGMAALLNIRYTPGYALDDEMLITEMVAMAVTTGGYTTPGGDYLSAEQVKAFLENTMDMPSWG
ncbi:MAG: hypothetical protein U5K33_06565 [Halofilum sp. (in: g-proteobacteria)]|nr:hypothetical protein [Halofilum sp. (in: g-proteobacteria)]